MNGQDLHGNRKCVQNYDEECFRIICKVNNSFFDTQLSQGIQAWSIEEKLYRNMDPLLLKQKQFILILICQTQSFSSYFILLYSKYSTHFSHYINSAHTS